MGPRVTGGGNAGFRRIATGTILGQKWHVRTATLSGVTSFLPMGLVASTRVLPSVWTRLILRWLDSVIAGSATEGPEHQQTGRKGEEAAYLFLRRQGYVMVARNFRTAVRRGEIDLIGWKDDVLCFIEVKTRTSHYVKPAGAAVDRDKQRELIRVAEITCGTCQLHRSGVLILSACIMRVTPLLPALKCSKMRSRYRKIQVSDLVLKGFSTCLN